MAKKVKFLGHAGFMITTPGDKVFIIDPWVVGCPTCPLKLEDFTRANAVLVTHDHFDHMGQAVEIANQTGATLVAVPETANRLKGEGFPEAKVVYGFGMNIGGYADIEGVRVTMTEAFHSSNTGVPCGYVLRLEDGSHIYHAGDTGIFESMRLIGELYPLDLALIPIGGCFVMDPYQAAKALKLLRPKRVIPMHYKSFPILEQSADRFVELARKEAPETEVIVLEPGQEYSW